MLSLQINTLYFKLRNIDVTARTGATLRLPSSFKSYATVFPNLNKVDRVYGGVRITTTPLLVDFDVVSRLQPNESDVIVRGIEELVRNLQISCTDTTTSLPKSADDLIGFANSGSWGTAAAATKTLLSVVSGVGAPGVRESATDIPNVIIEFMRTAAYLNGAWFGHFGEHADSSTVTIIPTANIAVGSTIKIAGILKYWNGLDWVGVGHLFSPTYVAGVPQVARLVLNANISQAIALPTNGGAVRITWAGNGRFSYRMGNSSAQAVISDAPAMAGSIVVLPVPVGATHLAVYGIGSGDCAVEGGT